MLPARVAFPLIHICDLDVLCNWRTMIATPVAVYMKERCLATNITNQASRCLGAKLSKNFAPASVALSLINIFRLLDRAVRQLLS